MSCPRADAAGEVRRVRWPAPLPVTAQWTCSPRLSPERVTVKVNGVLPVLPSAWLALAAAIASARKRVVVDDGAGRRRR